MKLWLLIALLSLSACGEEGEDESLDQGTQEDGALEFPDLGVLSDQGAELQDSNPDSSPEIDSSSPISLEPGEVLELEPGEEGSFSLKLSAERGEEYLLLIHGDWSQEQQSYDLGSTPAPLAKRAPAPITSSCAHRLTPLLPFAKKQRRPSRIPLQPRGLELGELRDFSVLAQRNGREFSEDVIAELLEMNGDFALWMDISSQPGLSISQENLKAIGDGLSKIILPRQQQIFGEESDVDGDGLVHVLFTPTFYDGGEGPMAFFYGCDLMDAGPPLCPYSNGSELLYLTPPSVIGPPYNTPNAILETAAHELNHLIYWNRKYLLNESEDESDDNIYLMEGLAELAQDLTGYGVGLFFIAKAGLDGVLEYGALEFVGNGHGLYSGNRDGILRGGAYLFARYLYDQAGGEEIKEDGSLQDRGGIAFMRALFDHPLKAEEALSELLPERPVREALLFDWFTALALSHRGADQGPLSQDPRFNYLPTLEDSLTGKQRGFNPYAEFHGMAMTGPATEEISRADGRLFGSGVEILRWRPEAGTQPLELSPDEGKQLKLRLLRLK